MLAGNLGSFTFARWAHVSENVLSITVWTDYANSAFRSIGEADTLTAVSNLTSLFARHFTCLRSEPFPSYPTSPRMFELVLFLHDFPRSEGG